MIKDYQKMIFDLMIAQELFISKLYSLFSVQFRDYYVFWNDLSKEEKQHADCLNGLIKFIELGEILFHEDNVNAIALNTFIEYIIKIIDRAEKGGMIFKEALSISKDVELSLIEKIAFTHFDSVSDRMKSVLNLLEEKTKNHIERISDMAAKER
jgi:hypothetical protein